ncbi:hypothetical protein FA15DRAFT_431930 [Coprinopsis marcescibilis]|uniref:Ricin B lectin domain-containing protein n=1 Tax=Coprinopsis marcescibilis TaxID=230819 RepID=A0A5C3KWC5_COPMA|nr:hypothetical protein FA15DRAFT_431930 [Coprinopsis marcescibilis]
MELGECQPNQIWVVDHFPDFVEPCVNESVYKIVNIQSGTVAHVEASGSVKGYEYNEGRNQLVSLFNWSCVAHLKFVDLRASEWEAIQQSSNPFLCSFKNILNGLYLSINGEFADNDTHIVATEHEFKWRLVVDPFNRDIYEIYVPYVNLSVDLQDDSKDPGTLIRLSNPKRAFHWRFEKVDIANRSAPVWETEYPGATSCECAQVKAESPKPEVWLEV